MVFLVWLELMKSGRAECSPCIYPAGEVCFDFNDSDGCWIFEGYGETEEWEWGYPSYVIDGNAWETRIGANYYNSFMQCVLFTHYQS